jgi:hypothetical protein
MPYRTDSELWLCGRPGKHAVAIIHELNLSATVELPPALFAVLEILVEAATRPVAQDRSWVPLGFVTAEEMAAELTRRGGGDPAQPFYDKRYIIRLMYRLRKLFAEALFPQGNKGKEWVDRFFETGPLGYRISTPPHNLKLEFLAGMLNTKNRHDTPPGSSDQKGPE